MNDQITTNEPKTITIDLWKAIVIVVTAMLASAGAGLWGAMVNINSDHFAVVAITKDIAEIKTNYMPVDLSMEKWKNNDSQHSEIIRRLDVIQTTLGRLK
jgi:hypothetical protein